MTLKEPLWQQLLLQIYKHSPKQRYISRVHRKIGGSLNHLRFITQMLHETGLIQITPKKKRKYLVITPKGERVVVALMTLKSEINTVLCSYEKR